MDAQMTLAGRDVVLAGDLRQANPIGDHPMYSVGDYKGKGQNKPANADRTPDNAWSTQRLSVMGMAVRDSFEDVCILRHVHRYVEEKDEIAPELREEYKRDALRFLRVCRGMADCDPEKFTKEDHAWLSRRNRSRLQMTPEGRETLRFFDGVGDAKPAPLLMDGRKDSVNGAVGANKINVLKLERLSAQKRKPILPLRAYHGKPKGSSDKPEKMDADDFRGMSNELLVCEGARVLLTQNLWVEAGLMNGALGHVVGYMWPENGDPHSEDSKLRSPLCVFVEFDDVKLGKDERGVSRSFFPDDPVRRNWVPIFRQRVSSTAEEHVWRENYPLQLAWAMTHWKAQGMTLDRSRVHLSERSVGIPGIAFVACTRVRHPWDLVFEEDLPEYEHFMKARRTPAFRERKRFELRKEAQASRTLRRYGYCGSDLWTTAERGDADVLMESLVSVAKARRGRLSSQAGRRVDADTWLWGDGEPDYEGELARAVESAAAGDEVRGAALRKVADRLLDRLRVRVASDEECAVAEELLEGVDLESAVGVGEEAWRLQLLERAEVLAAGDEERGKRFRAVARQVAACMARRGFWTREVEDSVPVEIQPLHMCAVKEALGALIPERLHRSLDKAVAQGKDDFGPVRGGAELRMDEWRVNVRAEDALARGRLEEEALEFFLKILQHVSKVLHLPVAIGSKTVGKQAGVQETPERLHRVLQKWDAVWKRQEVRQQEELVLPVAVDERKAARDWMCVVVRSTVDGEKLGDAKRLRVLVYDAMQRSHVAKRLARNVDVLVRGIEARGDAVSPIVEFAEVVECRVESQRILYAFGRVLGRVAAAAGVNALDATSESYLADVSMCARTLFGYLRQELARKGVRDAVMVLKDAESCRNVLGKLTTVPSLRSVGVVSRGGGLGAGCERRGVSGDKGDDDAGAGVAVGEAEPCAQAGRVADSGERALRIATWNIAGGLVSAQAPRSYSAKDQRAKVMCEILRWSGSFGCDVVCLQECEGSAAYAELTESYELAGVAEATANRGFVHVYVRRRDTLRFECVDVAGEEPCVAVRLQVMSSGESSRRSLVLLAVHLPAGDCPEERRRILARCVGKLSEEDGEKLVLLGDMNVNKEAEVVALCEDMALKDARYAGFSWGRKGNRFFADMSYAGPGLRKDRVLFGKKVWAQAHLVGQCEQFFEGEQFYLSDHFGVMAYVDVRDVYASRAKRDLAAAQVLRGRMANLMEENQQRELVEVKALRQAGREDLALAQQRARLRDAEDFRREQQRGARQRRSRVDRLRGAAFGAEGLFADGVTVERDGAGGVPVAPAEVAVAGLGVVPVGGFATSEVLPLRGMRRVGNTCYVLTTAQVLLRTPGMREWLIKHGEDGCPREQTSCVLCSLFMTLGQMESGFGMRGRRVQPSLALQRSRVGAVFAGDEQHDVCEFLQAFLDQAATGEVEDGRYGMWRDVRMVGPPVACHVDRIFGFVVEERLRCKREGCRAAVSCRYERHFLWRLWPRHLAGGPMTVSEMYLESCGPEDVDKHCEVCGETTGHVRQSRLLTVPNVLVLQVNRNPEGVERQAHAACVSGASRNVIGEGRLVREPVAVEERLSLPGGLEMDLVGVVYHNGTTLKSGHYTCLCRGPRGCFWFFDDDEPVARRQEEIAHIKPKEVYMIVYARRDQAWVEGQPDGIGCVADGGVIADDEGDGGGVASGVGGVVDAVRAAGAGGVRENGAGEVRVAETPRKRRLSAKSAVAEGDVVAASPVLREATTPERETKARRLESDLMTVVEEIEMSPKNVQRSGDAAQSGEAFSATPRRLRRKTSMGATSSQGSPTPRRISVQSTMEEQELNNHAVLGEAQQVSIIASAPAQIEERARGRGSAARRRGRGRGGVESTTSAVSVTQSVEPRRSARLAARTAEQTLVTTSGTCAEIRQPHARIVTGFGSERIENVADDERRRVAEGVRRAAHRREEGTRGPVTGLDGQDMDRAAGGPWSAGRR